MPSDMNSNSTRTWRIVFDIPANVDFKPIESIVDCREVGIHVGKTVRIINEVDKGTMKYAVEDCEVRDAERYVRVILRPLGPSEAEQDRLPPMVSERLNRVTLSK